jgi:hypothetical protein
MPAMHASNFNEDAVYRVTTADQAFFESSSAEETIAKEAIAYWTTFDNFFADLLSGRHDFSSNSFVVFLTNVEPLKIWHYNSDLKEIINSDLLT